MGETPSFVTLAGAVGVTEGTFVPPAGTVDGVETMFVTFVGIPGFEEVLFVTLLCSVGFAAALFVSFVGSVGPEEAAFSFGGANRIAIICNATGIQLPMLAYQENFRVLAAVDALKRLK